VFGKVLERLTDARVEPLEFALRVRDVAPHQHLLDGVEGQVIADRQPEGDELCPRG
jgi:hypothetical protein